MSETSITDDGIRLLVEGCKKLKVVAVDGCKGVTEEGKKLLRDANITV